jgi:GDPmannose 4,6-dehydratase
MHALITGACGQDGILLSRRLIDSGAEVSGVVKPGTDQDILLRYAPGVVVHECDLADVYRLARVVREIRPTEIYNLAGVSSIVESWKDPGLTQRINVDAVAALIAAAESLPSQARLLQASSGAIYEGVTVSPQDESTKPAPISPYAQSKAAAMEKFCRPKPR